jgi:hypothetical protein
MKPIVFNRGIYVRVNIIASLALVSNLFKRPMSQVRDTAAIEVLKNKNQNEIQRIMFHWRLT